MGKHKRAKQDPLNNCSTGSPDAQSLDVKMNDITDGSVQDQAKGQRGRWSINPKGTKPAKLTNSNYYPLLWMKLLDCAKAWMHQHVAIDNAFSALLDAITGPCQEALLKTIAYYEDNGLEVKASKYNAIDHVACSYIKTLDRHIPSTQGGHVKTGELAIQLQGQH